MNDIIRYCLKLRTRVVEQRGLAKHSSNEIVYNVNIPALMTALPQLELIEG